MEFRGHGGGRGIRIRGDIHECESATKLTILLTAMQASIGLPVSFRGEIWVVHWAPSGGLKVDH